MNQLHRTNKRIDQFVRCMNPNHMQSKMIDREEIEMYQMDMGNMTQHQRMK